VSITNRSEPGYDYNSGKPNYYQHDTTAHGDRQSPSDVQVLYLTVESLLKGC